mmetsp:Transcript_26820/g.80806  ORF Transcript_26820/g.80806 Transcript_26820/m.80806 type:complete len:258 (-) Transcript_26820:287-1060(-)
MCHCLSPLALARNAARISAAVCSAANSRSSSCSSSSSSLSSSSSSDSSLSWSLPTAGAIFIMEASQASSSCCALLFFVLVRSRRPPPSGPALPSAPCSASAFWGRLATITWLPVLSMASLRSAFHSEQESCFLFVKKWMRCVTLPCITSTRKPGPWAKWCTLAFVSTWHSFAPRFSCAFFSLSSFFFFFRFAASSASTRETSPSSTSFCAVALNQGTTRDSGDSSSALRMKPRCRPEWCSRCLLGTLDLPSARRSSW